MSQAADLHILEKVVKGESRLKEQKSPCGTSASWMPITWATHRIRVRKGWLYVTITEQGSVAQTFVRDPGSDLEELADVKEDWHDRG